MTKQTGAVDVSSFTTDAKFRTWGLACSTALQACGLVKTSDTGQINWVTVTKPVATNTKAGYEIYRFSDTLQATKPVFIRIDYGSGAVASGNAPGTWITVGTSTDGAGTITGLNTGTLQGYSNGNAPTNTAMAYYFTHTSNGYALFQFGNGPSGVPGIQNAGFFVVARTVNKTTGAATGDGVGLMRIAYAGGPSHLQYGLDFNTSTFFTGIGPQTALPTYSTSLSTASSTVVAKTYLMLSQLHGFSGTMSYFPFDTGAPTTFTASPFGTSHTYITWNSALTGSFYADLSLAANSTYIACATIWED